MLVSPLPGDTTLKGSPWGVSRPIVFVPFIML